MIMHALRSITKAGTNLALNLKRKTRAVKARLIVFSLLTANKKYFFITSISRKLQAAAAATALIMQGRSSGRHHQDQGGDQAEAEAEANKAFVLNHYSHVEDSMMLLVANSIPAAPEEDDDVDVDGDDDDDGDDEEEVEKFGGYGPVSSLLSSSSYGDEELSVERDIDRVADIFIRNFHRQRMMEKQHSLNSQQLLLY